MKKAFTIFKRIFVRGILFTAPLALVLIILDKIVEKIWVLGGPIAELFPEYSIIGIHRSYWIVFVMVLIVGLLMGLIARIGFAARFIKWIESRFLNRIPGYTFMKQTAETIIGAEDTSLFKVVLFRIEEAWKIAYVVEEIDENNLAIYVPSVPNPTEGELYYVSRDRVKECGITYKDSVKLLNGIGLGSSEFLKNKLN